MVFTASSYHCFDNFEIKWYLKRKNLKFCYSTSLLLILVFTKNKYTYIFHCIFLNNTWYYISNKIQTTKYWQLKTVQTIVNSGRKIIDHKHSDWSCFGNMNAFTFKYSKYQVIIIKKVYVSLWILWRSLRKHCWKFCLATFVVGNKCADNYINNFRRWFKLLNLTNCRDCRMDIWGLLQGGPRLLT